MTDNDYSETDPETVEFSRTWSEFTKSTDQCIAGYAAEFYRGRPLRDAYEELFRIFRERDIVWAASALATVMLEQSLRLATAKEIEEFNAES